MGMIFSSKGLSTLGTFSIVHLTMYILVLLEKELPLPRDNEPFSVLCSLIVSSVSLSPVRILFATGCSVPLLGLFFAVTSGLDFLVRAFFGTLDAFFSALTRIGLLVTVEVSTASAAATAAADTVFFRGSLKV